MNYLSTTLFILSLITFCSSAIALGLHIDGRMAKQLKASDMKYLRFFFYGMVSTIVLWVLFGIVSILA